MDGTEGQRFAEASTRARALVYAQESSCCVKEACTQARTQTDRAAGIHPTGCGAVRSCRARGSQAVPCFTPLPPALTFGNGSYLTLLSQKEFALRKLNASSRGGEHPKHFVGAVPRWPGAHPPSPLCQARPGSSHRIN